MRGSLPWLLILVALALSQAPPAAAGPAPAKPAPAAARTGPRGAIVVGLASACRTAAKELARSLYADKSLRPTIDEATARALVGERAKPPMAPADEPAPPTASPDDPAPAPAAAPGDTLVELVEAIAAACGPRCGDSDVARRLMTSLGRDLDAQLVVAVRCADPADQATAPATAHVLRVADGQFVPVLLTAQTPADAATPRWPDAARVLRAVSTPELTAVAPPRPVAKSPRPTRKPSTADAALRPTAADGQEDQAEEENGDWDILSSPWFWGGLGVLVAAGVTVFALSQSSLDDPDTVRLEGRIAP